MPQPGHHLSHARRRVTRLGFQRLVVVFALGERGELVHDAVAPAADARRGELEKKIAKNPIPNTKVPMFARAKLRCRNRRTSRLDSPGSI